MEPTLSNSTKFQDQAGLQEQSKKKSRAQQVRKIEAEATAGAGNTLKIAFADLSLNCLEQCAACSRHYADTKQAQVLND